MFSILVFLTGCSTGLAGAQSPNPLPSYSLSSLNEKPEICQLKENSRLRSPNDNVANFGGAKNIRGKYTSNATAFPFNPTTLPVRGQLNVSMVFVDWSDSPGNEQDYKMYQEQAKKYSDFYWMASEHKLRINLKFSKTWFRIPGSYQKFIINEAGEAQRGEAPLKQAFYDAAVAASDAKFDYSNVDIVLFSIPTDKTVFESGGPHEFNFDNNGFLKTEEGNIYNIAAPGDWWLNHLEFGGPWLFYAHETGHMLGIPHQANESPEYHDNSRDWKTFFWLQNPINGYEIMGNQDGPTRTISTWLRWLAGWLDDSQVKCVTEESIKDEYFELYPINEVDGKTKALVIKLSETLAVVVEARRFDKNYDQSIGYSRDGIIAYTVDATLGSSEGSMALLSPRDITKWLEIYHWNSSETLDGTFCEGDSVKVAGLTIEAAVVRKNLNVVRVSKSDSYVDPLSPRSGNGSKGTAPAMCVQ
jgi:M6 family metalloprotease-like protein